MYTVQAAKHILYKHECIVTLMQCRQASAYLKFTQMMMMMMKPCVYK